VTIAVTGTRHALLSALHPDGYRDVRAIKGRDVVSWNYEAEDLTLVDLFVETLGAGRNCYVGVATRIDANTRDAGGCVALHALFAEIDFKDSSEVEARAKLAAFPIGPSVIVSSGGGLHCYWLLDLPLDLRDGGLRAAKQLLRALALAVGGDLQAAEPARVLRLPDTLNYKYDPPRLVVGEVCDTSRRYSLDALTAIIPAIPDEAKASDPLPQTLAEGSRNTILFKEGARLRRLGWDQTEIRESLSVLNSHRCSPPLDASEIETIARSCARYEPATDTFPTTEVGDAEFFAACNADTVRYDHRRGRWLLFNGNLWEPQANGEIVRRALDSIRARQRAAIGDKDRMKWAIGGEARKRLNNLLALAQNMIPIADAGDSWDLLGAPNGVIDLKSGTLRPGLPEDRITMRVRVPFDPDAACPIWDRAVAEIFKEDRTLIKYFDRYVGYSLTGDCREESLAFCWGNGANGKGTLMNTLSWVLNDYADDLPFSAFEIQYAGIPNDIAKIVGKRFITASETCGTQRLNEARVKALTGRDPITARFLHKEFFTFQPVAKFWLATNQKPDVLDDSDGFWRRIHLIPFTASFVNSPDRTLKDRLRDELPGILARAVRGCIAWQSEGLNAPDSVKAATRAYRADSSPFLRFLDIWCVVGEGKHATSGELFDAFRKWSDCIAEGETRIGKHEFGRALDQRFEKKEIKQRVTYLGIGLRDQLGRVEPAGGQGALFAPPQAGQVVRDTEPM
jgi:putative DNA primase/helicase